MEENRLRGLGLESISGEELQIRGGTGWIRAIRELVKAALAIAHFVNEYGEDMERGFKRGWDSI